MILTRGREREEKSVHSESFVFWSLYINAHTQTHTTIPITYVGIHTWQLAVRYLLYTHYIHTHTR